MSRPTKYRDEFADMALRLCRLGLTDAELALMFDVDETTINRWKRRFPEFCLSIKQGKLVADAKVAEALYRRATGWQQSEDDIRVVKGAIRVTPTVRHYPPDTTACIFWMKNRQPDKWRDRPAPEQREVVIVHNALQIPGAIQPDNEADFE